jgi:tRNA-splicing ligase RtcB
MTATLHQWLADSLPAEVANLLSRLQAIPQIQHIAVMPDVHLAGEFCIGTVIASTDTLFPNAVGNDIGCGMCALAFDADAEMLEDAHAAAQILAALYEVAPAKRHHRALAPPFPQDLLDLPLSPPLEGFKKSGGDAHLQLGTLGGGNHFLELQADASSNQLWLMIHSGSRNAGQVVYHHHLPAATRTAAGLQAFPGDSPAGQAYLRDMAWARCYAAANRAALAQAAARALRLGLGIASLPVTFLDADHNHLQRETHFGQAFFVHRKGAQAATFEQPGLIPGSMATASVHTLGRGCPEALTSSSHGAGRTLSRHQAKRTISASALKQQLRGIWYDHRIADALREEGPDAYRNLQAVLRAQHDLTRVVRTMRPVLSYKSP